MNIELKMNNRYEILTERGFEDFGGVKRIKQSNNIKFYLNDNNSITVTKGHRFLVGKCKCGKVYRKSENLKIGDKIDKYNIINIEHDKAEDYFYDLYNVDNSDYITNNITSHNCDEISHCDSESQVDGFFDSVMPIISQSKKAQIIFTTTPNGYDKFYKLWSESLKGINDYKTFKVTWRRVPGRDEAWKKKEIDRNGPLMFLRNQEVTFQGSSSTLLTAESLVKLDKKTPISEDFIHPEVKLYKEYDETKKYILTADTSKTVAKLEPENDYICVNILELSKNNIEQALTYRTNTIHYTDLAQIMYDIGTYFNFPLCVIEVNDPAGNYTAMKLLDDFDYPNMYFEPGKADYNEVGLRTTRKNRPIGLSTIKKLIDKDILTLNDKDTIDEFFTFVKVGKRYEAGKGATDDCIMSLSAGILVLIDNNNELEVTISDYLAGDVELIGDSDNTDVNFFGGTNSQESLYNKDIAWLLAGGT